MAVFRHFRGLCRALRAARTVDRVPGIDGPAVDPDLIVKAPSLLALLRPRVARLAEGLQGSAPEQGPVASMGDDVVDIGGDPALTLRAAIPAGRLDPQLLPLPHPPRLQAIPPAPG